MKECSDYVIDTSLVSPAQLKARISELFLSSAQDSLSVHCISFGFKFGIPMEADLVFDVRCLPNPFYDEALRPLTGLDAPVRDYVMEKEETQGFVSRFTDLIDYLLPLYSKEGKSQLVIAVGCTGGHHRFRPGPVHVRPLDRTGREGQRDPPGYAEVLKRAL